MKVHFGASTAQFDKYQEYYFRIRDYVVKEGHVMTRDWIQMHRHDLQHNPRKLEKIRESFDVIYKDIIKALYKADVLITENTVPSFSNGHLMTLAIQRKIPVLVLHYKGGQERYLKRSFLDGIDYENLIIKDYNENNLEEIIKAFLNKFENSIARHRFHLVIDDIERKYIDWAGFKYGESRTRLIRKAIRKMIDEDKEYEEHLKRD